MPTKDHRRSKNHSIKQHNSTFVLYTTEKESKDQNAPQVKHYELSEYLAMIEQERNEAMENGKDWNEGSRT